MRLLNQNPTKGHKLMRVQQIHIHTDRIKSYILFTLSTSDPSITTNLKPNKQK